VAHARPEHAGVAQVGGLLPDGAVVAAGDAHHPAVSGAAVGDAPEAHRDLDIAPLGHTRRVVDVHARHVAADLQDAGAVDGVAGVAVVGIEPAVGWIDATERARAPAVPLRNPRLSARQRGQQHADTETIKSGRTASAAR